MKISACLRTRFPLPFVCGALLAALPVAPSARAQTGITTWAQSYGVGSYDRTGTADPNQFTSGTDTPTGVAAMPDGGFVVAGDLALPELWLDADTYYPSACAALVRYAADGTILWQQVLRQDNDKYNAADNDYTYNCSHISQVLTDAQGNIFLNMTRASASVDNNVAGVGDFISLSPTVAKFTADGALVWQAAFGGDAYGDPAYPPQYHHTGAFGAMSLTADGGVAVCGGEGSDESGFSAPYFFKIDADGSLGLHRAFAPTVQYESALSVAQSADGAHYIVSMDHYGDVLVTDVNGTVVAQRDLANDAGLSEKVTNIFANADGTFTLCSYGGNYGGPYPQLANNYVRKVNADLTSVWETVVTTATPSQSVSQTSDGSYLLTMSAVGDTVLGGDHGSPKNDAVVVRLDANGTLVTSFLTGGPDEESVPFAVETVDGGYALAMTSSSYHLDDSIAHPDWWMVKADETGHVQNFKGARSPVYGSVNAYYDVHANTTPSPASSHYGASPSGNLSGVAYSVNGEPQFVIENLASKTGINDPTKFFQAEPEVSTGHPPFFNGESALQNGVYYLSFPSGNYFGYYGYLAEPGFVYHFDLGYGVRV